MTDGSSLINIGYINGEFFRKGKEECLNTRNTWLNSLRNDLNNLENTSNSFPRIKQEIFYKTVRFGSNICPTNKKKIWIGPLLGKYLDLFNILPYNFIASHIEPSLGSILKLLTSNISFNPISNGCYINLYKGIIDGDKDSLEQGMDELTELLKSINLDLIIMHNDSVPINRAIILVARELGIPTVEIQHGVLVGNYTATGREVDYLFVWGEYYKDFYVKNNIKKDDQIKILGYPYPIKKYNVSKKERPLVTYLGQPYEQFKENLFAYKIDAVKNLNRICDDLNFDFVFRPHPLDDLDLLRSELKDIKFTSREETMDESLEKGDIFVGFDSTALVEANLNSKLAIQLRNYDHNDYPTDDYEKLGACTKSVETFDELENYMKEIKNEELSSFYRPVNENYIETPRGGLESRFLELINEIL